MCVFETDDDAIVARIISCIDHYLDTPQELGLLCVVPQKTEEMMIALNDTLLAVQDILVRVRFVVVIVECLWSAENTRGIAGSRWGV